MHQLLGQCTAEMVSALHHYLIITQMISLFKWCIWTRQDCRANTCQVSAPAQVAAPRGVQWFSMEQQAPQNWSQSGAVSTHQKHTETFSINLKPTLCTPLIFTFPSFLSQDIFACKYDIFFLRVSPLNMEHDWLFWKQWHWTWVTKPNLKRR